MNTFDINLALLQKYDRPGPRYTSYPTAPQFTEAFGPADLRQEIVASNNNGKLTDLSLYFHIPFCDTLCYFCGCHMIITHNRNRIDEYVEYLRREIALVSRMQKTGRRVAQVHWGGGTPTYLSPEQIARLTDAIHQHFELATDAEVSVEIDPRGLTREHLAALRQGGFNRASLGVQDFEPAVQQAVNRIQSYEETRWTMDTLRELGFNSINLDLIYGLPFQTEDSFDRTLDLIVGMNPDRLAVFNYAHVPWMKKHQQVIKPETLPKPEEKLRILKRTIEKLAEAGYVYIGMDHFAKPDDELAAAQKAKTLYRNFQGYSTHAGCDLYAFGISGISQLQNVYAQNLKDIPPYYQRLNNRQLPTSRGYKLTSDDHLRRHVIMRLMCDMMLDKREVEKNFAIVFDDYFAGALAKLEEFRDDDLLALDADTIQITPFGRLFIRNIAMAFDAYLDKIPSIRNLYSRTV
ncbi:oxygen-independent coproporphyrinogen III oxidase [candidate division KSB1 bacterium]|nr:oxygen-independent coproporphyrinogen III oxidase [candidate division KSB1 bacterium]